MDIQTILNRSVAEVIERDHLEKALKSGKKLRVKLGIDPTSPNIHIGRAVVLWKLRAFQELGHKIVFIVGDFTGLIGDTSDKDAERPMMAASELRKNMKGYFDQAFKILDKSKTETHYNSEWLKKLGFLEVGEMADLFGLHEFAARENVAKRMKVGKRVSLREMLYPIMQGYDSVAIKADVELGGTDQRFNLLAGRVIQKHYGQKPQDIVTTTLLEGTDGRKMSSSWGNVINLTDKPDEMFGKVMSISDDLIKKYFLLCTSLSEEEIKNIIFANKNPKDQKTRLAKEIVTIYHSTKAAEAAATNFEKKFGKAKGEVRADVEMAYQKVKEDVGGGTYTYTGLLNLFVRSGLASSKMDARRKIDGGGLSINEHHHIRLSEKILHTMSKGDLIRLGKRFLRIV